MSGGCSYCGSPVKTREQIGRANSAGGTSETRYECGSVNHSDGFDRSARCREIQKARNDMQADQVAEAIAPTAPVLVTEEPKAPAATAPETIESKVEAWRAKESALRAAVAAVDGVTIATHAEGPVKGRKAVDAARLSLKRLRTGIEAERKALKAPIVALGNLVDSEAKRLTAIVEPREIELEREALEWDAEQARIKREAEEAERKRVDALVAQLVEAEHSPIVREEVAGMSPEFFAGVLELAQGRKAARDAEKSRLAAEEAERLRLEREAREAEEARIRAEIAEKDAELEAQRLELAKAKREAEEAKAELERIRRAAVEAQEKAEREAREEEERNELLAKESKEAHDAEVRREAQRPDREKIAAWCESAAEALPIIPDINDNGLRTAAKDAVYDILNRINLLAVETKENA